MRLFIVNGTVKTVPYNLSIKRHIENQTNQTLFLLPSRLPKFLFCLVKRLTLPSYQMLRTRLKKLEKYGVV